MPQTKRTSPAARPATTKPASPSPSKSNHLTDVAGGKPAAPEPFSVSAALRAPVGDPNHPTPFFEPAELSRTHELIVDAICTMLTTGGHPDDVDKLLRVSIAHTRRRTYEQGIHGSDPRSADRQAEIDKEVAEFVRDHYEDWKYDLVAAWRKNRRKEPGAFEPKSITDRIRFNVRETLTGMFEEFMGEASPEEQRFLLEVFQDWSGRHFEAERGSGEVYLGMAFEYQLTGRPRCYVRVPEHMVNQVQKYVDALRAIEDREDA